MKFRKIFDEIQEDIDEIVDDEDRKNTKKAPRIKSNVSNKQEIMLKVKNS